MDQTLDLLLSKELPKAETKEVKVKRLSEAFGADVVFTVKSLSYNRVSELRKMDEDTQIHILMAGVVSPDLKSKELMEKYSALTPVELIKKILLPGEIEDISREIEKLSGYRMTTIEEIKKK